MTPDSAGTVTGSTVAGRNASQRTRSAGRALVATWVRTHPGMTVALLVPVVVFGIPQLFGGTFLTGDNMIQNLPLRTLVGWDLDHGVVPLWNPYLFSGTPLLAGFNAGAAYPLTWLTAVLPLFTAWTLTLVLVYDAALAGTYLFLRRQGLATMPATFGAVTFAFAGYMTAQMVHVDLIQSASWLPWILLAVHELTGGRGPARDGTGSGAPGRRHTRLWVTVLSLSLGLAFLTGNAEAVIDSAVLVTIYWLSRVVTMGLFRRDARRALASSTGALAVGVVGGIALGAAQWLPGLVFLSQSQRAMSTYTYFSSGSLSTRLLALLASPFLLGTAQNVPGGYVGTYNFQEVTSYAGILALIAGCSLLVPRWRRSGEARHWWVWYVILVVGVLSALGGETPFGHLMYLVPGIRSERLLSRNLLLVDFSLAVLLAWWLNGLVADRAGCPATPTTVRERWRTGTRSEVVATCVPVAVMAVLCALLWADGPLLGRLAEIQFPWSSLDRTRVAVLVTVQLGVAAAATWIVLVERRFTTRRLTGLLSAVLVADLVLFNVFVIAPPTSEADAQARGPASAAFRSLVGNGRFLIYNPDELYDQQLLAIGQTDLNIYGRLPSGQGYSALTGNSYYLATGSHYQEDLDPESLAGTVWDGLNVTTLLSLPGYFIKPAPGSSPSAGSPSILLPGDIGAYRDGPEPLPETTRLAAGAVRVWYFGGVLTVRSWEVALPRGRPAGLRAGLVTPDGGTDWLPASDTTVVRAGGGERLEVDLHTGVRAGGLVVGGAPSSASVVGTPDADTQEAGEISLDGRMQFGVTSPHWRFTGMLGPFGVFANSRAQGWAGVRGPGNRPAPAGSSVTALGLSAQGSSTLTVHATSAAVLVRSEAWADGWQATIQAVNARSRTADGAATVEPVEPDGVLQQVRIPAAGTYRVTFRYVPWPAVVGIAVSGAAAVVLLGVGAFELAAAIRRRWASRG